MGVRKNPHHGLGTVWRTGSLPVGVWPWPTLSMCRLRQSMEEKAREGNKQVAAESDVLMFGHYHSLKLTNASLC